jgi:effector-binding domain-containing protein
MAEFSLLDHPAEPTAMIRDHVKVADLPAFFGRSLPRILAAIDAQHLVPSGEPFAYYHGTPNKTVDVETGFPVRGAFTATNGVEPGELPKGRVITGLHVGPYEKLADTYAQIMAWAQANGLRVERDMWEVYLTDPEREPDPTRWQTRIFLEVE